MQYAALPNKRGARAITIRNRIVEANLGLVFAVWRKRYSTRIPYGDALGIGAQGLIAAVERFDHTRGLRFSTYATHWIRHALGRTHANEGALIRLPVYVQAHNANGKCVPARDAARRVCSLDAPIDPDTRETFANLAPDAGAEDAFDAIEQAQYRGALARALAALPKAQRAAAALRAEGATLAEVAALLGVSRDHARQLETQALGALRRALAA